LSAQFYNEYANALAQQYISTSLEMQHHGMPTENYDLCNIDESHPADEGMVNV